MSEKFSFTAYGKNGKEQMNWNAEETAAIVIDMWDKHWCQGASKRVEELAPAMNEFLASIQRDQKDHSLSHQCFAILQGQLCQTADQKIFK